MQKGKPVKDVTVCRNCGGTKFKRRDGLSAEEWEIARRFLQGTETEHSVGVFCARCLKPAQDSASTA